MLNLRALLHKKRAEQDLDDELRFHLERQIEQNVAQGMSLEEAHYAALRTFGNMGAIKEECRDSWGVRFINELLQDVRYGLRQLRHNPSLTAVAILTLALGIGANTAIFTVVNSLLFRPLPVEQPGQLVAVFTTHKGEQAFNPSSYPDYSDLRDRNQVFSGVAAHFYWPMSLKTAERPKAVMGEAVTGNYFNVLGVEPFLGRAFLPEEVKSPDSHAVALLSYRAWERDFNSDREIIGKKVLVNDYPFTLIGVTPRTFTGLNSAIVPAVWVPVTMIRRVIPYPISLTDRYDPWLLIVARLKPDVSVAEAGAAIKVLAANLDKEYPSRVGPGKSFSLVESNRNRIGTLNTTDGVQKVFALLMMVVGVVLLITCFNVANLQLARATGRQREIALRTSFGASRVRIVRQLLTENVLLSLLGGLGALFVGAWAADLLLALRPPSLFPFEFNFSPDWRVFLYTLLLSVLAGILFGLSPALQSIRSDQLTALKEQTTALGRSRRKSRIQDALVVAQIALSLVLLVTAGLFARSLQHTLRVNPGFKPRNALVVPVDLGFGQYPEPEGREFEQHLVDRVRALPGVRSAALAVDMPLGQLHLRGLVSIDGYVPKPGEQMVLRRNVVGPEYFQAMGIPILEGREIDERDRKDTRPVAVINQAMAERYWPGQDPIGKTFENSGKTWAVVGVIKNGKYDALTEAPQPYFCLPLSQTDYVKRLHLVARTIGSPRGAASPILQILRQLGPNLPSPRLLSLNQYLEESVQGTAGPVQVVGIFALLALALALVGVYGVMSYSVGQRTNELGIRMALGANRNQILRLVLRRGFVVSLLGVGIGLVAALALSHALTGMLYGVKSMDTIAFSFAGLGLMLLALIACYIPAFRATRISPMLALRYE
jgi:macrolide transport system ATP-binding/permease protein